MEDRKALAEKGYAPRLEAEQLQERVTTLRYQQANQMDEISKSENEITMLNRDITAQRETFRAEASGELSEARAIIATRGALVEKANRREALQVLTSPMDAVVKEIAVTTIGEVAEPGQPLITLVPAGDELIIETFPFMRYGFLEGGS